MTQSPSVQPSDAQYRENPGNGSPPLAPPAGDDYRTMAMIAWALLLAGLVKGFAGIAAVIVAYIKRDEAPPLWQSHYNATIRMFWIWAILSIIGGPLILLFGLGFIVLAVATIWTAVVGVLGLVPAAENRAPRPLVRHSTLTSRLQRNLPLPSGE
jgi:uncharacterized membrane protein